MSNDNTAMTFWELIKGHGVKIPKLQRDYAQGRNEISVKQIRESLIDALYESLKSGNSLVLNFIYGEMGKEGFIPVDGQQRLTTLFLLHWYVFKRTGFEGLSKLSGFSYETRDTSRRFCEHIISDVDINWEKEKISDQIKECYWFTRNFDSDPTIKSMLVVIDAIHKKFYKSEDAELAKNALIDEDCPVSFLWLQMEDFQQTSDLYIKMNARGKLLSDFEIFKAKLQNSNFLKELLRNRKGTESEICDADKVDFISKYNNKYAEMFYQLFVDEYDEALMDFIREIIRDEYLSFASKCGVPTKTYRSEYGKFKDMSGSVLFRYMENGGNENYKQCNNLKQTRQIFVNALEKVDRLLEYFNSMNPYLKFENTLGKDYYDEEALFKDNHRNPNLREDWVRYSLYSFLFKFGIPTCLEEKEAYSMWKRIIFNIAGNSELNKRPEDTCEAFVFIQGIVDAIEVCEERYVLNAFSMADPNNCANVIRPQVREEQTKARLIQIPLWKKEILDAEAYFKDGCIGFILEFSKDEDGTNDVELFHEYFECLKMIFDSGKKLKDEINTNAFEQAMLCMKDGTDDTTSHLLRQNKSESSWGFLMGEYTDLIKNYTENEKYVVKRKILKELVDEIKNSAHDTPDDINKTLENIKRNFDEKELSYNERWKAAFIRHPLFGVALDEFRFSNCIYFDKNYTDVFLLTAKTQRSKSMELYTFLLYQELQEMGVDAKLELCATSAIKDKDGFPTRYIKLKKAYIGYDYGSDETKPFIYKQGINTQFERFSKAGILEKIKSEM